MVRARPAPAPDRAAGFAGMAAPLIVAELRSADPDATRAAVTAAAEALRGSARLVRDPSGVTALQVDVPRDAYPALLERVRALGAWRASGEPPRDTDPVRLLVRLPR
jgi:hypothetical protein